MKRSATFFFAREILFILHEKCLFLASYSLKEKQQKQKKTLVN